MNELNNYSVILTQIKQIEKEIQDLFKVVIRKETIKQYRPRDFCRRSFYLDIFFDMLNIGFFTEDNMNKMKDLIVRHDELRTQQKLLESDIDKIKANDLNLVRGMYEQ